jgi:glycosyltransferase involved in cell wall biosynthesis
MGTSSADTLKISVVIATYGRAETIRKTLGCLSDQTLDPDGYEVIVIDDESPDHTREVVAEWQARAKFRLSYIHHKNRGPGYTQNRGIEVAAAPLVLLMADDIFMQRGALEAHVRTHAAHAVEEVAILGRVEQDDIPDQGLFLRKWDAFGFRAFRAHEELPYYRFWACNISAKRHFLLRHGCFREHKGRAGYAAHEDAELGFRLSKAGLSIVYCPDALGLHHHVVTFEEACKRRYMQGLNFGEFHAFADAPEISVAYHVLNWKTLPNHFRALFGPRRRYLMPADRNPAVLMLRHLARGIAFNGLVVRAIWQPLLRRAEHDRWLARLVWPGMYRGVIFSYFLRGCRDGDRQYPAQPRVSVKSPG